MEISDMEQKTVSWRKGGIRTMPLIMTSDILERIAQVGLQANLILYLTREYHLSNTNGTNIMLISGAISNFLPIFSAFLSDSYLGRFHVMVGSTIIFLLGTVMFFTTSIIQEARPAHCNPVAGEQCGAPDQGQLWYLYLSLGLMSVGSGGMKPCTLAFAADQLDNTNNPRNENILQTFFNWYYASVGVSVIFSLTVIVYLQDKFGWPMGFGIPAGMMFVGSIMFLVGSPLYVKVKPDKSLLAGLARVIVASWKNKNLPLPANNSSSWCHDRKTSKLTAPTDKLWYLNKACIIIDHEKDLTPEGLPVNPWSLCSVKQVEELKIVFRVLPICSTRMMISNTVNLYSFPILQAVTMNRHLTSKFEIPAGSIVTFGLLSMTIWVAIYGKIVVPVVSKITKNPRGFGNRSKMGIGLLISCLSMTVAAIVEKKRRRIAHEQGLANEQFGTVTMSVFWLVPQFILGGLSEGFNAIGQIEFFYSQFPKTMSSVGMSLFSVAAALGNLLGSLIVKLVENYSKNGDKVNWLSNNFNQGHLDYFYCLLCILNVLNFFYYILCSWAYGPCENKRLANSENVMEEEEDEQVLSSYIVKI